MVRALRLFLARRLGDRRGVTAAEYAVLAVGIVMIIAVVVQSFGGQLSNMFNQVTSAIG